MNLTLLPYELEENIIEYLQYAEVANYCLINKRAIDICDTFFKRRRLIDNIPIHLLPTKNLTKRYIQLYDNMKIILDNTSVRECVRNVIINNDINQIKWLTELIIKRFTPLDEHIIIDIFMDCSLYAFDNNKQDIGKWLLWNLSNENINFETKLQVSLYFIGNCITYTDSFINYAFDKDITEILYYMLDFLLPVSNQVGLVILAAFAKRNDIKNLDKITNNYNINVSHYNFAIYKLVKKESVNKNPKYLDTLKFLLEKYPGNRNDLNKMLRHFASFYAGRDTLPILMEYGLDDYWLLLHRTIYRIYHKGDNVELKEDLRSFLLNYGDRIPRNLLLDEFNNKITTTTMKIILSEYLSYIDKIIP